MGFSEKKFGKPREDFMEMDKEYAEPVQLREMESS